MSLPEVVLAGARRTPIGRFGGALAPLTAPELGGIAGRAVLEAAGIAPGQVDEVVFGNARQAGVGPNPARQVGRLAGIPDEAPARTVNQACASGLRAILDAASAIRLGEAEVALAGGTESMSNTPYLLPQVRFGEGGFGNRKLLDGMFRDGFRCPLAKELMGETAETLADRYALGREACDWYAALSQRRAEAARKAGRFEAELAPVRSGKVELLGDEHPRDGVSVEKLATLPPVFRRDGVVHAGNSSGITDGAAAVVALSGEAARRHGVRPSARLVAHATAGVDPQVMGIGPVPAVRRLCERSGVPLSEVALVELNEAFAPQVLACSRELELDPERLNVNGGAIALGHPIGASGARIVATLLAEMERRAARYGIATLCVSGGMGVAALFENLNV